MDITDLPLFRQAAQSVFVDRKIMTYAVRLADATRNPERYGLEDISPLVEFGASPRAPIGVVQAARSLALLRGRDHATIRDVRDLAPDVMRHRLVLSYEAIADGVAPDEIIGRVLGAVDPEGGAA
jgi:MoxR-like ATPase